MMILSMAFPVTVLGMGWYSHRRWRSWPRTLLVAAISAVLWPLAAAALLVIAAAAVLPGGRARG